MHVRDGLFDCSRCHLRNPSSIKKIHQDGPKKINEIAFLLKLTIAITWVWHPQKPRRLFCQQYYLLTAIT